MKATIPIWDQAVQERAHDGAPRNSDGVALAYEPRRRSCQASGGCSLVILVPDSQQGE